MSQLKLYNPSCLDAEHDYPRDESDPVILSFHRFAGYSRDFRLIDPLNRARVLRKNSVCPHCHKPDVTPLQLNDARLNRNGKPVPGTATIVGFHCQCCRAEWPA